MVAITNFPAALDSVSSGNPFGFAETPNFISTTLNGDHNNSVTTITVISTTGFPTRGFISIETEVISYTGTTATTFTGATRASDGTTAAAHLSGSEVAVVPTARHHNDLAAAIVALETKLGIGTDTAANNELLRGTGAGTTDFGQLRTGDIPTGLITSTHILDGTILNADLNAAAAVSVSKLANGAALALLRTNAAANATEWGSSGQIDFPATQNASAGANTLDDYEEGTFTPTIIGGTVQGNQTYAGQSGRYTKIGRFVMVEYSVNITAKDGAMSGSALIGGLPFAAATNSCGSLAEMSGVTLSGGYTFCSPEPRSGNSALFLIQNGSSVAPGFVGVTALSATTGLVGSAVYSV